MATLATLRNDTLLLLNESGPVGMSVIGQLPDAFGGFADARVVTFTISSANITGTFVVGEWAVDMPVVFSTTGALGTNFVAGTTYYITSISATTMTVSLARSGTNVVCGASAGSAVNTATVTRFAQVSSQTTIDQYLNEAAAEMARSCVYIPTSATVLTYTGSVIDLRTIASPSTIWYPKSVSVGTTLLEHTSESRLRAWQENFETFTGTLTLPNGGTTTSTTYWYKRQPQTIGLFPAVASSSTVTIYGGGLPPTITDTVEATFAPDDVLRNSLPVYAAYKLAMKNLDDPSLANRIQIWQQWWFDTCQRLWTQLDSSMKVDGTPYSFPPPMPPAAK